MSTMLIEMELPSGKRATLAVGSTAIGLKVAGSLHATVVSVRELTLEAITELHEVLAAVTPDPVDPVSAARGLPWRVGRKVGRTVYDVDDQLIGVMDTPALAARVVAAVNAQSG